MIQCREPAPEPIDGKIKFCTLEMDHTGQHEVWCPNLNTLSPDLNWQAHRWSGERDTQLHLKMEVPRENYYGNLPPRT